MLPRQDAGSCHEAPGEHCEGAGNGSTVTAGRGLMRKATRCMLSETFCLIFVVNKTHGLVPMMRR
jgi:hypothetical protein